MSGQRNNKHPSYWKELGEAECDACKLTDAIYKVFASVRCKPLYLIELQRALQLKIAESAHCEDSSVNEVYHKSFDAIEQFISVSFSNDMRRRYYEQMH